MPADCRSVCSVSECQLHRLAGYRVVVSADVGGAISSAIGAITRKIILDVSVNNDQPLAAMPSHSYIALIRVQHSTSLLSAH